MASNPTKYTLAPSEEDRISFEFKTEKNKVKYFIIQYYAKTPKGWRTIIRYDCAHGYLHIHTFGLSRKKAKRTEVIEGDYNQLFTELRKQVLENLKKIKENYLFQ